jgi:hypothetical protein
MLGDGVGRNEYIDQKPGMLWKIKAAGGPGLALNWNKVSGALFTRIEKCGEGL